MKPTPMKPKIIMAQVDASGTAVAMPKSICLTDWKPFGSSVETMIDEIHSPLLKSASVPMGEKSVFAFSTKRNLLPRLSFTVINTSKRLAVLLLSCPLVENDVYSLPTGVKVTDEKMSLLGEIIAFPLPLLVPVVVVISITLTPTVLPI